MRRCADIEPHALSIIELFQELPARELKAVAARCRTRRFERGETVVHDHERSSELFFVLEGRARVQLFSSAGRDVSYRDLGPGEMFGELAAIDGGPRSANVIAVDRTRLAVMSASDFLTLTREHPAVCDALMRHLVALIRRYSQRVFELSTLSVEERIRLELLRLSWKHTRADSSAVLDPAPTLAELASRVSTTREAVSREIARLARNGLLERKGQMLVVFDVGRLASTVDTLPA